MINYLRLLSTNPKNKTPICIYGLDNLLNKLYREIKEKEGKPIKVLSKSLGIKSKNGRAIFHWLAGENPIPISKLLKFIRIWSEINNKNDIIVKNILESAFNHVTYFSVGKGGKAIKLPKNMVPNLAYLTGVISGDGHLATNSVQVTSDSKSYLEKVLNPMFRRIFAVDGNIYIYKKRRAFELSVNSRVLVQFFNKVLGIPIGNKRMKLKVPEIILKSTKKNKAAFIAGFFDTDGYVSSHEMIAFNQKNKKFLLEIKKILEELGIETRSFDISKREPNIIWKLSIRTKSAKTFLQKIPSFHPNKIEKFYKIENSGELNVS